MKQTISALLIIITLSAFGQQTISSYPEALPGNEVNSFFGKKVPDPYSWLEKQDSPEVLNWVNQENTYTYNYIKQVPYRLNIQERIQKNTVIAYMAPFKYGKYFIAARVHPEFKTFDFYYNTDLIDGTWDELSVTKDLKKDKDELLSLSQFNVSKDSKYIAFSFNRNGGDWKEIKIAEINTGKVLEDHLSNIRFSQILWRGNGFYYMRYDSVDVNNKFLAKAAYQRVYYHKLGDEQERDSLVFKRNDAPYNTFEVELSDDNRFLFINDHSEVTNISSYYYYDFTEKELKGLKPLLRNTKYNLQPIATYSDTIVFLNKGKGMANIVGVSLKNPKKLFEVIPELKDAVFKSAYYNGDEICVIATQEAEEKLIIFNKNKSVKKVIAFPFGVHYSFRGRDPERNKIYMAYESFLHPPVLLSMDLASYKFDVVYQAKVNYESQDYEVEKVIYQSDTTKIPMLLMHKKGIKLDGTNPVLMEFYGGFGISYHPAFDPAKIMFIENGGIFAYPLIRGGGEMGVSWHEAGRLFNKINSINDIANAARFLIDKKYTSSQKLAISGGSQGGLMASAVAIKYPDLFKVVIPVVGIHDMLKMENYTTGMFYTDEYGTVKDSLQFENLYSYSPIHNISEKKNYPAMLIMTSDHDDRVPPLHSYKLAATLQGYNKPNVLLRVEKNAGHYGASGYEKNIIEMVDFYSFLFYNLGIENLGKY